MASFDLWTPEFCLGCDKQTDGAAYCSESCKLADFEKTSSASTPSSSSPSSPSLLTAPSYPWTQSSSGSASRNNSSSNNNQFFLSPAYDFPSRSPTHRNTFSSRTETHLSPSSSYSSLCSMQTAASTAQQPRLETVQLSERAQKELREYAISFEYARLQRRRSY